jgi:ankyrin repeat protein
METHTNVLAHFATGYAYGTEEGLHHLILNNQMDEIALLYDVLSKRYGGNNIDNHAYLFGLNALTFAVKYNRVKFVEFILSRFQWNLNDIINEDEKTTFIDFVLLRGSLEMVKLFIQYRHLFGINRQGRYFITPFVRSCFNSDERVPLEMMNVPGIDIHSYSRTSALHIACLKGHFELSRRLLRKKEYLSKVNTRWDSVNASIMSLFRHGETPIDIARRVHGDDYAEDFIRIANDEKYRICILLWKNAVTQSLESTKSNNRLENVKAILGKKS